VSLHRMGDRSQSRVRLWARGPDDHWAESGRFAVPHASNIGMLDGKPFFCSYDETARAYGVVDLTTRKLIVQLEDVPRESLILASGSPVPRLLLIVKQNLVGSTLTVHLWDVSTGLKHRVLHPKLEDFASVTVSMDGRFLA